MGIECYLQQFYFYQHEKFERLHVLTARRYSADSGPKKAVGQLKIHILRCQRPTNQPHSRGQYFV